MKKETFKTKDGKFTFEEGKSYFMKYKSTSVYYIWESIYGFYRTEYITSKKHSYEGYILTSQLPGRYNWKKNIHKKSKTKKPFICEELSPATVKKMNADFNTWEINQEEKRQTKRKMWSKKHRKR